MNKSIFVVALVGILGWASVSQAQTLLLSDTFTDGNKTNGVDALDTAWFTTNSPGTNLTIVSNRLQLGGTGVLPYVGAFVSPQTIDIGWAMELMFDFNFTTTPTANAAGLRFGLYSSNGTAVTTDNSTGDDNDNGYFALVSTGSGVGGFLRKELGADGSPLLGSDNADLTAATASPGTTPAFGTTTHTARMLLTRTSATQMLVELLIDNVAIYSATDSTSILTSFDEVVISRGAIAQTLQTDNINVEYYETPEPASLSALGLLGLTLLRRRRSAV